MIIDVLPNGLGGAARARDSVEANGRRKTIEDDAMVHWIGLAVCRTQF
jgi:hypothetical protein